jgi:AcrR family transcriptional regulator
MSRKANKTSATPRGERRKAAILDAAIPVIADGGYRGSSLATIAAAVNLTQQGVLHHFGSKEELLLALLEDRDREDGKRLSGLITEEGLALLDVLEALVDHNATAREQVRLFNTLVAEATSVQHPAHEYFVDRYRRIRARALRSLHEGQESGEIRADVDLERLIPVIIAVMDGLQIQWLLDPDVDMQESFRTFVGWIRDFLAA